jgi:GNAT superfamily N-acetyltransferase
MEVEQPPVVASLHRTIEPLGPNHDRAAFSCLDEDLTKYFCGERALREALNNDASVYVCSVGGTQVLGFFTLSSAAISRDELCRGLYGNGWKDDKKFFNKGINKFPYPSINATILGRLSIHADMKGKGFGEELIVRALEVAYKGSLVIASKVVILDAKNPKVASIYAGLGFKALPDSDKKMYMLMDTVKQLVT